MSRKKYYIPQNFAMDGVVFGFIQIRNLIETIAILILIGIPIIKFPISIRAKIYMSILVFLPLGILSIVGINGLSLTSFLYDFLTTFRNKKVYTTPTSQDRIRREKSLIQKKHKKIKEIQKQERKQKREGQRELLKNKVNIKRKKEQKNEE